VERMVERLRSLAGDRSLLPLSAVVVGVQRGLWHWRRTSPNDLRQTSLSQDRDAFGGWYVRRRGSASHRAARRARS
jgi:hypothetical protein